jgi:hypothetical protein
LQGSKAKQILKKKTEFLDKRLKSYKRDMQKLRDSIKRLNLQIMGIEEGENVQAKGIGNTFKKINVENSPNLKKKMPIQIQETSRTPNRQDQNRISSWHSIHKTTSTENKERILKAAREKN